MKKKRRKGHHYAWATFTLPSLAPSPPHGPVGSLPLTPWLSCFGTDVRAPCLSQTHQRSRNCCLCHVGPTRQIALPCRDLQNRIAPTPSGSSASPFAVVRTPRPWAIKKSERHAPCSPEPNQEHRISRYHCRRGWITVGESGDAASRIR